MLFWNAAVVFVPAFFGFPFFFQFWFEISSRLRLFIERICV